jgi:hypothetical protein
MIDVSSPPEYARTMVRGIASPQECLFSVNA